MPKHKGTNRTIYIDAKDRFRGPSGSNFVVRIIENLTPIVGTMIVKEISIPFTFYQINSSNNQIPVRELTGGVFSVFLEIGNYSAADLEIQLKDILDTGSLVPQTYDVVFSSITGKLTITASVETFEFQ